MDPITIRGKHIGGKELEVIRGALTESPLSTRTEISRRVCARLQWMQPNGRPQDVACREILRTLEKRALIALPAARTLTPNQIKKKEAKGEMEALELPFLPKEIQGNFGEVPPVTLRRVEGRKASQRFTELMNRHHYLGYQWSVGRSVKYLFEMDGAVVGGISWGSGAWKVGCRDEWIGWDAATRARNVQGIACNLRFLIAPWVKVKNLASHLLSRAVREAAEDWRRLYGVELCLVESFVQKDKFRGTCYKAANWIYVGDTKGRGRGDRYNQAQEPVKGMWVKPLCPNFREILCSQGGER